jgi:hypothetical protein
MASDVAGAIKTAFGAAVTTVSEVLKNAPAKRVTARTTGKKSTCQEGRKKSRDKESRQKDARKEGC